MYVFLNALEVLNRKRKARSIGFLDLLPSFIATWLSGAWKVLKTFLFVYYFFFMFCDVSLGGTGSMEPTCKTNDTNFVSLVSYGLRPYTLIPRKFSAYDPIGKKLANFWNNSKILNFKKPNYGDVITFFSNFNNKIIYGKRIIGLPGDKVKFENGYLFINDKLMSLSYVGEMRTISNGQVSEGHLYEEDLNGLKHKVLYSSHPGDLINWKRQTTETMIIPLGHYCVAGDNRTNSNDTFGELGTVEENNIFGLCSCNLLSARELRNANLFALFGSIDWKSCLQWMI